MVLCHSHIMCHQRGVIAVHRAWCVEQHRQQILPDIPNPCCILFQAVHNKTDMLTIQLQQFRPHDFGRVVIACNTDSAAGAANRLLQQINDLVKLLPVNVRIVFQNVVVDILQNQLAIAFKRSHRFRSLLRRAFRKTGRERNRIGN